MAVAAAAATGLGGATAALAAPAVPTIPVACSVTALNNAISSSPSNSILVLKSGCVYVTANALSNVTRNLTIVGSNDTIRETGTNKTILHVVNVNLSVSNLTFTGGDGLGDPGAIHNQGGTLTITGSTFRDNTGNFGGAIQNSDGGSLSVASSTFADNSSTALVSGLGGAIYNSPSSNTTITSSSFVDNTALSGGAIYLDGGSLTINGTSGTGQVRFADNDAIGTTTSTGFGAAVDIHSGVVNATFATFADNDANLDGGAIRLSGYTSTLANSGFTGNFAGRDGGAIETTKGLNLNGDNISANRASHRGGGIYVGGGSTTLSRTFVTGNFAAGAGLPGGGIYRNSGSVTLTNGSLVTLNRPNNCTGLFC